ncbi:MAG: hypothetical protein ACPGO3_07160 [Magnetospiraceae bacterium]
MSGSSTLPPPTLALNTKVEDGFVAPLTAIRGALEILRDFPDLEPEKRQKFLETALRGCDRLAISIDELARSVYEAGDEPEISAAPPPPPEQKSEYDDRIQLHQDLEIMEIDFSDFVFNSSATVNAFYDAIENQLEAHEGRSWYFMVNYKKCSIWPEAWVAFAHRGKKIKVNFSLGTLHFIEKDPEEQSAHDKPLADSYDPDMCDSRQEALNRIAALKKSAAS